MVPKQSLPSLCQQIFQQPRVSRAPRSSCASPRSPTTLLCPCLLKISNETHQLPPTLLSILQLKLRPQDQPECLVPESSRQKNLQSTNWGSPWGIERAAHKNRQQAFRWPLLLDLWLYKSFRSALLDGPCVLTEPPSSVRRRNGIWEQH